MLERAFTDKMASTESKINSVMVAVENLKDSNLELIRFLDGGARLPEMPNPPAPADLSRKYKAGSRWPSAGVDGSYNGSVASGVSGASGIQQGIVPPAGAAVDGQSRGGSGRRRESGRGKRVNTSSSTVQLSGLQHLEAATAAKFSEIVNLVNDTGEHLKPKVADTPNSRKRNGRGRRSHHQIVGERVVSGSGDAGIRAATTYGSFHVTKLHPDTSSEDLTEFLRPDFPEVKVLKLDSLHPESYSSFKITVCESNEKRILNPSLWPSGCKVNRFFHARKKTTV